jgi:hypothetical protein
MTAAIGWRQLRPVLVRPWLWSPALRLAPRGWWRRPPHLPVPDPSYLRFRMVTMYGDATHVPEPDDLVTYLEWCRRFPVAKR